MKKAVFIFVLLLIGFTAFLSFAEDTQTVSGYFTESAFIRKTPQAGRESAGYIPAYTPVTMTYYNEKYAEVTYNGMSGYVYIVNLEPLPRDTEAEPYTVFCVSDCSSYEYPLLNAKVAGTITSETPVRVIGTWKGYLHVQGNGIDGYVTKKSMTSLIPDEPLAAYEAYVEKEAALLVLPLANADEAGIMPGGKVFTVEAENRGYLVVQTGGIKGYLKTDIVKTFGKDKQISTVGFSAEGAELYAYPALLFPSGKTAPGNSLLFLEAVNGGFYRLPDGTYIASGDVKRIELTEQESSYIFVDRKEQLLEKPAADALPVNAFLEPGRMYSVSYVSDVYYLLKINDIWGFIPRSAVSRIRNGEAMNRTFAVAGTNGTLYLADAVGETQTLESGTLLYLTEIYGREFYLAEAGGIKGYLYKDSFDIIGSDAPVTEYRIETTVDKDMLSYPDARAGEVMSVIPAGSKVRVMAFNRCYLLVSWKGTTGYVTADTLRTEETALVWDTETQPRYVLFLNKAAFKLTVYYADEEGNRTDRKVFDTIVVIGRRTTPTPSGIFDLGFKMRWIQFSPRYAPHVIIYAPDRYIHGILCDEKDEDTIVDWALEALGTANSGGCIRCPMDAAEWIYFNCPSYTTVVEIVNGVAGEV